MFFDVYQRLCESHGLKPGTVAKTLGIPTSLVTKWKKTGAVPRADTLNKIADYFGVSVDFLLGNESDQKDILDEIDIAFIGNYKSLDEEQQELLREMARTLRRRREEKGSK